jgi:DNA-binding NarL/FixJ family response regulator
MSIRLRDGERSGSDNGRSASEQPARCVLLADRHHSLIQGVRGLLETAFGTIFMVADEASLLEGVERLTPSVAIVDLALARGD